MVAVLGLAGTVRHDRAISSLVRHLDGFQRFAEGADLVHLDQDGIGDAAADAFAQALGIGDKEIVADELHAAAERAGQRRPAVPIVLGHAVLDGEDGIALHQVLVESHHLIGAEAFALALHLVLAALEELAGGDVETQRHLLARLVAGVSIAFMMKPSASSVRARFGAKPPSSPTFVEWPAAFSCPFRA